MLLSALYRQSRHADAGRAWGDATRRILAGQYGFLLERERALALPLLADQLRIRDPEARAAADALLRELMRTAPPALHISGLGGFEVRQGYRCLPPLAWQQRKAGELFRFLLVQPRQRSGRDAIIEALWPGKPPAAAERLLQQATWTLRHVLEPDLPEKFPSRYLTVADHQVTLGLPPGSTADFMQFEQAISGACAAPPKDMERALALYAGALFPMDQYADWSAGPRERLAGLRLRGLLCLAGQYLDRRRHEQAIECCDRVIAEDAWNEEAVRLAMRACLALGDRVGALRRYEALKRALRRGLRLAPCDELRDLAATLTER